MQVRLMLGLSKGFPICADKVNREASGKLAKINDATFTGQSGTKYSFNVYPFSGPPRIMVPVLASLDPAFKGVSGVYAVTRRYKNSNGGYSHEIIYVGETGDLSTRFYNHHKTGCFEQHEANCFCTIRDDDADSRLSKEADLIKKHNPPCNG
jgi:hypothetical protein